MFPCSFHLDHCGALPYFLTRTGFKGKVVMTHPTKAIYYYVLSDYVKICNIAIEEMLYDENDIKNSLDKIMLIDYHQVSEVSLTCRSASIMA